MKNKLQPICLYLHRGETSSLPISLNEKAHMWARSRGRDFFVSLFDAVCPLAKGMASAVSIFYNDALKINNNFFAFLPAFSQYAALFSPDLFHFKCLFAM